MRAVTATAATSARVERPARKVAQPLVLGLLTGLFFTALLILWFSFDHRTPTTDEAGHILNSLSYTELLGHARPFKASWIHKFLTVNSFYPPAVYIFAGALKLVFGTSRVVDVAVLAAYTFIASASIYGIAYLLTENVWCGVLAAAFFNMYPQVQWLNHVYMLDFPLAAMAAFGLFMLLWWNSSPTWRRAIFTGAALAAACMTKQIAVAFLFPCGVWCFVQGIRRDMAASSSTTCAGADGQINRPSGEASSCPSWHNVLQLLCVAAMVAVVALPWLMANYQWVHQYAIENAANMKAASAALVPWKVFPDYLQGLAYSMSPLLAGTLCIAFFGLRADDHKRLLPLYVSAFGGLLILSFLSWTYPLDRYATSALVFCSVATACGAARWTAKTRVVALPVLAGVLLLATAQTASFSFTPYPVSAPPWLVALSARFGVSLREFRGARIPTSAPVPATCDWGQTWCLSVIHAKDKGAPWLNIMPSDGIYNPHTFELLAREMHTSIRPTTSRRWTIEGDEVSFTTESAQWFDWYLFKTGGQGNKFKDANSAAAYDQLAEFVKTSGCFRLQATKQLSDGTTISLYRRN